MYRLFRDATRYVDGHHTKDLFALNRDLKKVSNIFDNEFFPEKLTIISPEPNCLAVNISVLVLCRL